MGMGSSKVDHLEIWVDPTGVKCQPFATQTKRDNKIAIFKDGKL
jgi:hypothetical protein